MSSQSVGILTINITALVFDWMNVVDESTKEIQDLHKLNLHVLTMERFHQMPNLQAFYISMSPVLHRVISDETETYKQSVKSNPVEKGTHNKTHINLY